MILYHITYIILQKFIHLHKNNKTYLLFHNFQSNIKYKNIFTAQLEIKVLILVKTYNFIYVFP